MHLPLRPGPNVANRREELRWRWACLRSVREDTLEGRRVFKWSRRTAILYAIQTTYNRLRGYME